MTPGIYWRGERNTPFPALLDKLSPLADVRKVKAMLTRDPVLEHMGTLLDGWEQRDDRRCVFLRCYSMMTANVVQALEENRFYNRAWVATLLHRFADYYFDALDAYERGSDAVPAVWKQTHDLAGAGTTTVMENLLLGINAHINYDLALAITDVLDPEWSALSPAERQLRYQDHREINRVIAETIDSVQGELATRYAYLLQVLDNAGGLVDEWKIAHYITRWRDDVWRNALRLLEAPDQEAREAVRQEIESIALKRAALIFVGDQRRSRLIGYKIRWLRRLGLF